VRPVSSGFRKFRFSRASVRNDSPGAGIILGVGPAHLAARATIRGSAIMTIPEAATAEAELIGLVVRALEGAAGPLSASGRARTLPRPFKREAKALTPLLDEQARRGRWHRFAKGRTASYGLEPPDEVARGAVLAAVAEAPRTWAELKKAPGLKVA